MALLCLKIFSARILDVSISTFRTMIMVRGEKIINAILAFIEVFIWFFAARSALTTNVNTILIPISYSLGYATGSYIGMILSDYFIKGIVGIEIITTKDTKELIKNIKKHNFGVSEIKLTGDDKKMLYIQTKSDYLEKLKNIIIKYDKNAFIIVNDTKYVSNGWIK